MELSGENVAKPGNGAVHRVVVSRCSRGGFAVFRRRHRASLRLSDPCGVEAVELGGVGKSRLLLYWLHAGTLLSVASSRGNTRSFEPLSGGTMSAWDRLRDTDEKDRFQNGRGSGRLRRRPRITK